jgi:cysteine desulfurase / selenocysteine lyase
VGLPLSSFCAGGTGEDGCVMDAFGQCDAAREREFPLTRSRIYLNTCARGLLPVSYIEAVNGSLTVMSNPEPGQELGAPIEGARQRAAQLLNCGADEVALLWTTSHGLNLVPNGLDWQPGDEVVLYEMDHPTDVYTWLNLASRGVRARFVKDQRGRYEPEDVEALLGPRTRAVCLSLVNYGHGFRAPVEAIGEICRRRGIWLVVDAIMAMGALRVDARAIGADIIAAQGYKFLLSGFGVAVCYTSERARRELRVSDVGYKAMERAMEYAEKLPDFHQLDGHALEFSTSARRFEPGTQALALLAGMEASLGLMLEVGPEAIEERVLGLATKLTEGLVDKGYQVVGSTRPGERSAIVSFTREGLDVDALSRALKQARVDHALIHQRARFSPHFYNDEDDVEVALRCL